MQEPTPPRGSCPGSPQGLPAQPGCLEGSSALSYGGFLWREGAAKSCPPFSQVRARLSKERCRGRMQKGAGELEKAARNKTQLVNSIGKSRWELRRGAGSGWCNLGDGDKEPEGAAGAQRGAGSGRGAAGGARQGRREPLPCPELQEGPGVEPWRGTNGSVSGRGSRRVRQVRHREREARWADNGREAGRRWWCRSKRKDQTGTGKSRIKAVPRLLLLPHHSQNCLSRGAASIWINPVHPPGRNGCSSPGTWAGFCFSDFPCSPSHSPFALSLWHKARCSKLQIPTCPAPSSAGAGHCHLSLALPWREQKPRQPSHFPLAGQGTPRVRQGIKVLQLALILITHNTDELISLI